MDIRDFQVFLAVTKRLNFTRAGEDVHLSQPSVSEIARRNRRLIRGIALLFLIYDCRARADSGRNCLVDTGASADTRQRGSPNVRSSVSN
jgi:hypothetical protein